MIVVFKNLFARVCPSRNTTTRWLGHLKKYDSRLRVMCTIEKDLYTPSGHAFDVKVTLFLKHCRQSKCSKSAVPITLDKYAHWISLYETSKASIICFVCQPRHSVTAFWWSVGSWERKDHPP
jgi:hypothetical protein